MNRASACWITSPDGRGRTASLQRAVMINAQVAALTLGFAWLAVDAAVLAVLLITGRRPAIATDDRSS
jgi:hypothetical protein